MITPEQVQRHLKLPTVDEHLEIIVGEVNGMVNEWHGEEWPAGVELGAIMLAARLHRRRNSSSGVEAFSELGTSYVSRYDADLDRQLRINSWSTPVVG